MAGLVIAVVERVIGESFSSDAQRQLIDRTISEVEADSTGARQVSA